MSALPDSIGMKAVLTMVEEVKTWNPDNMYEHVNGEDELLKRYGVVSLAYAAYENESGGYLSADILDLGAAVNAYGLYNLYAGCIAMYSEGYGDARLATERAGDVVQSVRTCGQCEGCTVQCSQGIDIKAAAERALSFLA